MPSLNQVAITLVLAMTATTSAEFQCSSDTVPSSTGSVVSKITLSNCEANLATFNSNQVWSLWATQSESLFKCADGDTLVSSGCASAANHIMLVNIGANGVPGFTCTADNELSTTSCQSDLAILNAYVGAVSSEEAGGEQPTNESPEETNNEAGAEGGEATPEEANNEGGEEGGEATPEEANNEGGEEGGEATPEEANNEGGEEGGEASPEEANNEASEEVGGASPEETNNEVTEGDKSEVEDGGDGNEIAREAGETTTTEAPGDRDGGEVNTDSNSRGKKGKKGSDNSNLEGDQSRGKSNGRRKRGKGGRWGFGAQHDTASSVAIVAGSLSGCVLAVAAIWRARKIIARKVGISTEPEVEEEEEYSTEPLISRIYTLPDTDTKLTICEPLSDYGAVAK